MLTGSKHWMTLQAWLQVTLIATAGSCKAVGPVDVVSPPIQAQRLGAFTLSWISHVDWPPSVAAARQFSRG